METYNSPDAREKPRFFKRALERQQEKGLQIKTKPFAQND